MKLDQFENDGIVVDKALGFWLNRVYQRLRTDMYRAFAERGEDVTPEQWMVLIRLWEREGLTQSELSDLTLRDAPTMSRIVQGMEERGLLERRKSPEDARVRTVFLTKTGHALRKKLVPVARMLVERAVRGIPERDLRTFRSVLERMFENLEP
ncbi:MAG TPA: MarR family winged helix-turn-helix transcriptional regulator [Polyangiaceae bacterium]|nr:MarR family winged helix-turn-helix transcriptional regulator [Polyangiaceae bacterium]